VRFSTSGALSRDLYSPATTGADNAAQFAVVLGNLPESVTSSNTAILTVSVAGPRTDVVTYHRTMKALAKI
jgi:hypothetical protein